MSNKYIAGNKAGAILEVNKKEEVLEAPQDVELLLSKCTLVLSREVQNLLRASASGKLDKGAAGDLVSYLKLLTELRKEQEAKLASLTDDELERLNGKSE